MQIVSSIIVWQNQQADGSLSVRELHTDNLNATYTIDYVADPKADLNAHLAADAAGLLISVPAQEISTNIYQVSTFGSLAVVTFNYSVVADNVAALRAAYKVSTQLQAIMMGDYLSTLTNVQLENAFGLTLQQIQTLRTNFLTPAANTAASIRAAVGT